jgi:small subunit ribosomal protein S1
MNIEPVADHAPMEPVKAAVDSKSPEAEERPETIQSMDDVNLDNFLGGEFQPPSIGDLRTGVVIRINDDNSLLVDVSSKREGIVSADDVARLDEETRSSIQVGREVPVYVVRSEGREGNPILSIYQARMNEDWLTAESNMKQGKVFEGEVSGFNRGGLVVQFGRIRGFVPASQVVGLPRRLSEDQRRKRLGAMVGERIGVKIIEVDRRRRRLIFSQRRALRAYQEVQRERVLQELVEGETRRGKVTDITSFGAFVDLGGADGLVHVSEMSWKRVEDPHDVLKVGAEVDVYVLSVDRDRKRIALSLKKLQPDPWTLVDDHYHIGQLVEGRVTRVLDFGAFIELDLGVEGLLHSSEMIGTPELPPADIVHPGEGLLVKVIRMDSRRRRVALSSRQVRPEEWEDWMASQQAAAPSSEAEPVEEEETVVAADVAVSGEREEQAEASEVSDAVEAESSGESADAAAEAVLAGADEDLASAGEDVDSDMGGGQEPSEAVTAPAEEGQAELSLERPGEGLTEGGE